MGNDTTGNEQSEISADFYFAIIPEWVLALPVSSNAIRTYCILRRFADNKTGECYPSRKLVAMRCRLSVSTLDRALTELVAHKAITVTPRKNKLGDWSSNLYVVHTFPNGGVSLPVMRPRPTGEQTGGVTRGEGTKAIRTKSFNKSETIEEFDNKQGISAGTAFARAHRPRQDLIDLLADKSPAFADGALSAYDRLTEPTPIQKKEASPTWQQKYD